MSFNILHIWNGRYIAAPFPDKGMNLPGFREMQPRSGKKVDGANSVQVLKGAEKLLWQRVRKCGARNFWSVKKRITKFSTENRASFWARQEGNQTSLNFTPPLHPLNRVRDENRPRAPFSPRNRSWTATTSPSHGNYDWGGRLNCSVKHTSNQQVPGHCRRRNRRHNTTEREKERPDPRDGYSQFRSGLSSGKHEIRFRTVQKCNFGTNRGDSAPK